MASGDSGLLCTGGMRSRAVAIEDEKRAARVVSAGLGWARRRPVQAQACGGASQERRALEELSAAAAQGSSSGGAQGV